MLMDITEEHRKIFRLVQETKEKIRRDRTMRDYADEELAQLAQWAEAGEQESGNQIRTTGIMEGMVRLATEKRKAYGAIRQGIDWLLRARILERQSKIEKTGSAPELIDSVRNRKQ